MKKLAIFGTGGFAKELLDLALDQGYTEICFLERIVSEKQQLLGFPIVSESSLVQLEGFDFVIGVAEPKIRKKIYESYPYLSYPNLIHSQASLGYGVHDSLQTSKGIVIAAGARITNSCTFGNFIIISFNSTIGHDCKFGNYVSIMPGVNVSGCVQLKEAVYIGTNATILPGKSDDHPKYLDDNSVIGASALVLKDTQANKTYVGSPARELNKHD